MPNTTTPRPMLAAKFDPAVTAAHIQQDGFIYVQPKIDGMRCLFDNGVARSRSWKLHPNRHLQEFAQVSKWYLHGIDSEVIAGHVYDKNVFRRGMSDTRSVDGSPEFTIFYFDMWTPEVGDDRKAVRKDGDYLWTGFERYTQRLSMATILMEGLETDKTTFGRLKNETPGTFHAKLVKTPTFKAYSVEEVMAHEATLCEAGWEGIVLRRPNLSYKWNRATTKGGELTKVKRWVDVDATITGYEPRYRNDNEATTAPLGFIARSSHLANLTPLECLGALHVKEAATDLTYKVGVFRGWDIPYRTELWGVRDSLIGRTIKVARQGYTGGYDAARTPVGLGFRED